MDSVLRGWVIGHLLGEALSRRREAQQRWCAIAYSDLTGMAWAYKGDRSDPGEINRPSAPVVCGEVDLGLSRAAIVGEARIPAAEAASQVVVEDSGADLEEELGSRR